MSERMMRIQMGAGRPALSILTVAFRPRGLWNLHDKLLRQTAPDIEHVVVMDYSGDGSGFSWCAEMWRDAGRAATGEYVTVLNDDEEPCNDNSVAQLLEELDGHGRPDILMVGLDYVQGNGARSILPDGEAKAKHQFVRGHIGPQCFVVKRAIWQEHAHLWTLPTDDGYSIDLAFMAALLDPACGYHTEWSYLVFGRMVSRGLGKPEGW